MAEQTAASLQGLALHGGSPVRAEPFPPRRLIGAEEKQAVMDLMDQAIDTGESIIYNGPEEEAYGREFAEFLGGGFADGVNSGTNALFVALMSLDLPAGSEVVCPPLTDAGGAMPVVWCNLVPVFADSAPGTFNTSAAQIEAALTDRTSAIVVAHIAGYPVDMAEVMDLAASRGLKVIEDCAQAHGAVCHGQMAGTFGDVAVFSTMFGKHHCTGGQGGVVCTRQEEMYWRIRRCADRGKPFGLENATGNVRMALNCNMDELHAAIGRVQLRKLPGFLQSRRNTARAIEKACDQSLRTVRPISPAGDTEPAYWFIPMHVDCETLGATAQEFGEALKAEGIPVQPRYFFAQSFAPWMQDLAGSSEADLPQLLANDREHFALMIHEGWGAREVDDTIEALGKIESALLAARGRA